jgi:hypothetical protein
MYRGCSSSGIGGGEYSTPMVPSTVGTAAARVFSTSNIAGGPLRLGMGIDYHVRGFPIVYNGNIILNVYIREFRRFGWLIIARLQGDFMSMCGLGKRWIPKRKCCVILQIKRSRTPPGGFAFSNVNAKNVNGRLGNVYGIS